MPTAFPSGPTMSIGVVPVDLDQDGDQDFLTGGPSSNAFLSTILNLGGSYVLGPILPVAPNPQRIAVADIDQDGDQDILADCGTIVSILLNNGASISRTDYASVSTTAGAQFVDFNSDGFIDLLVGAVHVRFGNGTGTFGTQVPLGLSTSIVGGREVLVRDLDGDGQKDLVYVGNGPGLTRRIEIWLRPSGTFNLAFAENASTPSGTGGYSGVAVGDFDQDGVLDIVAAESEYTCAIRTYRRTGSTFAAWQRFILAPLGDEIVRTAGVSVRDVDQDGDDDVVTIVNNGQGIGFITSHVIHVYHGTFSGLTRGGAGAVAISGSLLSPKLVDVVGGPGLDLVGVGGSSTPLTPGALKIYPNIVALGSPIPAYELSLVDGNQSIVTGSTPTLPLMIRAIDATNGQPAPGVNIAFGTTAGATLAGFAFATLNAVTDPLGIATATLVPQTISGNPGFAAGIVASTANATPIDVFYYIDGLADTLSTFASSGTSVYTLRFYYDRVGLPIVVAADSPPPAPISTSYGTIATSILTPGPGLFVLDGLGVFGPPDPAIVTGPRLSGEGAEWSASLNFPTSLLQGMTFVSQVYAIDLLRPPQLAVIVSNAVTRTF